MEYVNSPVGSVLTAYGKYCLTSEIHSNRTHSHSLTNRVGQGYTDVDTHTNYTHISK